VQHIPVDPALIPLPVLQDNDLSDRPTIAKACGRVAAEKVAGAQRTKGKGKECVVDVGKGKDLGAGSSRKRKQVSDDEEDEDTSKRRHPRGAGNYQPGDVSALLDFVEKEKPLGQRGWQAIHRRYTRWACLNRRPERTLKSLETKFKQVRSFSPY
jgi:hypothetical protein